MRHAVTPFKIQRSTTCHLAAKRYNVATLPIGPVSFSTNEPFPGCCAKACLGWKVTFLSKYCVVANRHEQLDRVACLAERDATFADNRDPCCLSRLCQTPHLGRAFYKSRLAKICV